MRTASHSSELPKQRGITGADVEIEPDSERSLVADLANCVRMCFNSHLKASGNEADSFGGD